MEATRFYRAEGLRPRIALSGDGLLEATLDDVLVGWAFIDDTSDATDSDLSVTQTEDGWTCDGITYDVPLKYRDPVAAACSLIANLFKAHTLIDESGLCLHAAGIETDGGVVLLTGPYRTGKSVVSAAAAAAGLRVFSDDIVPLSPDGRTAVAPGLAIRLRRPLPASLSARTRTFLGRHRVARSERYLYIRPPADRLAPSGTCAPIRAIAVLDRQDSGEARLETLAPSHALRETIRRNFARETSAGRILDTFDGLIRDIPCLSLVYSRAEDAAEIIAGGLETPAAPSGMRTAALARSEGRGPAPLGPGTMIRRAEGIRVSERAGELFLTDRDDRAIFNLNETGRAVWTAAAEPVRFGDLTALFAEAFPERRDVEIVADLSALVRRMARHGLMHMEAEAHCGAPEKAAQQTVLEGINTWGRRLRRQVQARSTAPLR